MNTTCRIDSHKLYVMLSSWSCMLWGMQRTQIYSITCGTSWGRLELYVRPVENTLRVSLLTDRFQNYPRQLMCVGGHNACFLPNIYFISASQVFPPLAPDLVQFLQEALGARDACPSRLFPCKKKRYWTAIRQELIHQPEDQPPFSFMGLPLGFLTQVA